MAYNCVASGDNSMTFNDGYHILHHLNSTTHWSELPARFMNLLQQHVATKGALHRLSVSWSMLLLSCAMLCARLLLSFLHCFCLTVCITAGGWLTAMHGHVPSQ